MSKRRRRRKGDEERKKVKDWKRGRLEEREGVQSKENEGEGKGKEELKEI